jgi:hypothetical protein
MQLWDTSRENQRINFMENYSEIGFAKVRSWKIETSFKSKKNKKQGFTSKEIRI